MKHLFLSLLCLAATATAHAEDIITKDVNIAVNDVFVPSTINANEDAKIILSGIMPNGCYRYSRAEVRHADAYTHEVKAIATVTTNTMCLMVLVPFSREVNLGRLTAGQHVLRVIAGDDTYFEKAINVQ